MESKKFEVGKKYKVYTNVPGYEPQEQEPFIVVNRFGPPIDDWDESIASLLVSFEDPPNKEDLVWFDVCNENGREVAYATVVISLPIEDEEYGIKADSLDELP